MVSLFNISNERQGVVISGYCHNAVPGGSIALSPKKAKKLLEEQPDIWSTTPKDMADKKDEEIAELKAEIAELIPSPVAGGRYMSFEELSEFVETADANSLIGIARLLGYKGSWGAIVKAKTTKEQLQKFILDVVN